jgi:hypothetical protein
MAKWVILVNHVTMNGSESLGAATDRERGAKPLPIGQDSEEAVLNDDRF